MNKLIFIFVLMTSSLLAQEELTGFYGQTDLAIAFAHAGSYGKERPIYLLEQRFSYRMHRRWSAGLGIGINAYPGALGAPLSIHARYHFLAKEQWAGYLGSSYGWNLRLGEIFFASKRNITQVHLGRKLGEKLELGANLGYLLLWDRQGGGNLSALLGLGLLYKLFDP